MSDILQPQSTSDLENMKAALRRSKRLKRFFAWIAVVFICGASGISWAAVIGPALLKHFGPTAAAKDLDDGWWAGGGRAADDECLGQLQSTVPPPIQNRNLSLPHRPVPQREERPLPSRRALSCSSLAVSRSADWQSGDDGARSRRANQRRTDAIRPSIEFRRPAMPNSVNSVRRADRLTGLTGFRK